MQAIRQAFELWATGLDLEALTPEQRELLHLMRTVATWESLKAQVRAAKAARGAKA